MYRVLSRAGDGWAWALVACVADFERHGAAVEMMVTALIISIAAMLTMKSLFHRERPAGARDWSRLVRADRYSFPSGHASTSFAAATSLSLNWERAAFVVLPLAALISLSRVRVGNHRWADVLGGSVLGCCCGLLTWSTWGWL
jgi:undecaprenyl-diphosphatase